MSDADATTPRTHDTVREMLEILGRLPDAPGCVFALVEAADPGAPIAVRAERGGCGGGGGRIVLTGRGLAQGSAMGPPTHLLVRCTAASGGNVAVLVERGTRGIPVWPDGRTPENDVEFDSARMTAEMVLTGTP